VPLRPSPRDTSLEQVGSAFHSSSMSSRSSPAPSPSTRLLSPERVTTLLVSVLVALCSGTNYVCTALNILWTDETYHSRPSFQGLFRYDIPRPMQSISDRTLPPAYGPQLGVRLGLSHTQQNLVGLGGNGTSIFFPAPSATC
jgi:hypothetical protein